MFVVEIYASVRRFVFIERHSRREAARVFGLNRETVLKMCRFSLPPGYTRTRRCCRDRRDGRAAPSPDRGSGDADGVRASELQHAVEDVDGDLHLEPLRVSRRLISLVPTPPSGWPQARRSRRLQPRREECCRCQPKRNLSLPISRRQLHHGLCRISSFRGGSRPTHTGRYQRCQPLPCLQMRLSVSLCSESTRCWTPLVSPPSTTSPS